MRTLHNCVIKKYHNPLFDHNPVDYHKENLNSGASFGSKTHLLVRQLHKTTEYATSIAQEEGPSDVSIHLINGLLQITLSGHRTVFLTKHSYRRVICCVIAFHHCFIMDYCFSWSNVSYLHHRRHKSCSYKFHSDYVSY